MTDRPYGDSPIEPGSSTTDVAKEQARSVAGDAKEGGQQVAATAREQTREVAGEAKTQAKQLFEQVRGELGDQASTQHQRAATGLRTLGDELGSMARSSQHSGVASDLAQQAAERVNDLAGWLESRQPGDVLSEVTDFARRKPGTFLAAAAAVGFLGGRLTRGLAAESSASNGDPAQPASPARVPGTDDGVPVAPYNRGAPTDAPAATTQPTPVAAEPAWPEPSGGAVPPTGYGATTGVTPGTGEERA